MKQHIYYLGFEVDYGNFYSHTYILKAQISGPVQNEFGMIMSFEELHEALKQIVPDHKFICCDKDVISNELIKTLHKYDIPYKVFPFMITSENLVTYFMKELDNYIKQVYGYNNINIESIEVQGAEDKHSAKLTYNGGN